MIAESQKPKYRGIVRVIALTTAIVQVWTQVCFSANFSFAPRLKEFQKDREESGYFSLSELERRERRQEKIIKQEREIQRFRETRERVEKIERLERALFEGTLDRAIAIGSIRDQFLASHMRVLDVASQKCEFRYIKYNDGRSVFFKDGLASRIENEKVPDAFGYESIRRVYNMTYNKKWLLESYEAETVDQFGKLTKEHWQAEGYSEDSVFYATDETKANQFLTDWVVTITDPYNSILTVEYSNAKHTGKFLTSYHKEITDCCGHTTKIEWSCKAKDYDSKKNLTQYHEEITDAFDNVTAKDWKGTYHAERLTSSMEESWTTGMDGSQSHTISENFYTYERGKKLIEARGNTRTEGEDAFGNTFVDEAVLRHEIVNGHLELAGITGTVRNENVDGSLSVSNYTIKYQYDNKNFLVNASGETTTTGEDIFGSRFTSQTTDNYVIIGGQAKRKSSVTDTESVNFDFSKAQTRTTVEYEYDPAGYLIDARSFGEATGEDVFGNRYETHSRNLYAIINGQPRVINSTSIIDSYDAGWLPETPVGSGEGIQSIVNEVEDFLNRFIGSSSEEKRGILASLGIGNFPLITLTTAGISAIVGWLRDTGTRIINCAINALYKILTTLGIQLTKSEIALKTILIDILTGTVTPENASGELLTSMLALVKEAASKGVNLSGAHLSLEQLQSQSTPVIAHIDGNHFVVVDRIDEGKVFLSGINGESMISMEEFSSRWSGDILTTAIPSQGRALTEKQMQEIMGASGSDTDNDPDFDNKPWLKYFRKIEEGNVTYMYYYNVEDSERKGGYNGIGIIQYIKVVRNSDGRVVSVHRESYNKEGVSMELLDVDKDIMGNIIQASRKYHNMGNKIALNITPNLDGSKNLNAIVTSAEGNHFVAVSKVEDGKILRKEISTSGDNLSREERESIWQKVYGAGEVFGQKNGFSGGTVKASPAIVSGGSQPIFTSGIDLNSPVTRQVINGIIDKFTEIVNNLSSEARGFFDEVTGGLANVVDWLRTKGEFIINCAVYALERILKSKGVSSSREELAADTIFTDIINQVITPGSEGKVDTSAHALETAAKKRGLELKSVRTDLRNLSRIDSPVIAYVGGNHFVVISKVEDGKVSGIETTGEKFTIPEKEFTSKWDGIIIAPRSPPPGEIIFTPPKIDPDSPTTERSYLDENGNRVIEVTVCDERNNPIKVTKTINMPDGSTSCTQTWTNYEYDNRGILISASGMSVTIGQDIFGNTYTTSTRNLYIIINGEAKVDRSISRTTSSNIDGSTSVTEGEVIYEYDPTTGLLSKARGNKVTEGNDIFGNKYLTNTDDTYAVIKGEAKLVYSQSETATLNIDGSHSKTTNWIRYEYTTGDENPSQLPSN
ncbi:cysteine peptidase family C39 domain-containing protein, partial [bacterium]|nr:cysteine peptidase family C39 domain-containing protein [bacterium]